MAKELPDNFLLSNYSKTPLGSIFCVPRVWEHFHEMFWTKFYYPLSFTEKFLPYLVSRFLDIHLLVGVFWYSCSIQCIGLRKGIKKFSFLFKVCYKFIFMKLRRYIRVFLLFRKVFKMDQYVFELVAGLGNLLLNLE